MAAATARGSRASALLTGGQLLLLGGDFGDAESHGRAALEEFRATGDTRGTGLVLQVLGNAALQAGDLVQARALHAEAVLHLRDADSPGVIRSLVQLALVACELGDTGSARTTIAEFEALGLARGDSYALAAGLYE